MSIVRPSNASIARHNASGIGAALVACGSMLAITTRDVATGRLVAASATVFLGGLDTLPSNIGWSLWFLATHPETRQQLVADPDLIPHAVEEFLRFYSVANPVRRAIKDVELGDPSSRLATGSSS